MPDENQVSFALAQNHPNPFGRATTIDFALPAAGRVHLVILDVQGRLVRTLIDGQENAGRERVTWDGRDQRGRTVQTGVYFYELRTDQSVAKRKLVLLR